MSDETRDGGLKAGTATLVDSSPLPAQAKKPRGRVRHASPKFQQKGGRSGPQRGIGGLKHSPSAKGSGTGKRYRRKTPDVDHNRQQDFLSVFENDTLTASSSKYVNDPRLVAMAKIDLMSAEVRLYFMETYPVVDEKSAHRLAGGKESDKMNKAKAWRSAGQIIGLPFAGITIYPVFQFQPDGQPYPLIREVIKAFTKDYTDWQRASWLVSPCEWLNGETPISAIHKNDSEVVDAAIRECEVPVG